MRGSSLDDAEEIQMKLQVGEAAVDRGLAGIIVERCGCACWTLRYTAVRNHYQRPHHNG